MMVSFYIKDCVLSMLAWSWCLFSLFYAVHERCVREEEHVSQEHRHHRHVIRMSEYYNQDTWIACSISPLALSLSLHRQYPLLTGASPPPRPRGPARGSVRPAWFPPGPRGWRRRRRARRRRQRPPGSAPRARSRAPTLPPSAAPPCTIPTGRGQEAPVPAARSPLANRCSTGRSPPSRCIYSASVARQWRTNGCSARRCLFNGVHTSRSLLRGHPSGLLTSGGPSIQGKNRGSAPWRSERRRSRFRGRRK